MGGGAGDMALETRPLSMVLYLQQVTPFRPSFLNSFQEFFDKFKIIFGDKG